MPRLIAFDVLNQVLFKKRPLDEAYNNHPNLEKLPPKGKAFSRAIITTTLRNKGFIDYLIDPCLTKRPKGNGRPAMNIMRLAVAQLYFMNIPAHAAVSEALILAGKVKLEGYKKLINAVLRRLEREKKEHPVDVIARQNIPDWLYQSWTKAYGEELALELAKAHLEEAPLDLTLRHPDEVEIWAKRLWADILPHGTLRLEAGGRIEDLDGFQNGSWWVQDAAAALPARLLGDISGQTVLDLCAAPGGKTMQLAARGAKVISVDKSENRLKKLRANLERTKLESEIVCADLMEWEPDEPVDAILLDAPCTATGTLRRHPDGLWTKKPQDIEALTQIQGKIWHRASRWVKPGGKIVYCTCSLQPEEGELMFKAFLKGHKNFEAVEGQTHRLLPSDKHLKTDGFFCAVVKRLS